MLYPLLIKPLLFSFPPEKAHKLAIDAARLGFSTPLLGSMMKENYGRFSKDSNHTIMGLNFKNKVGLAAGFDKDGKYLDVMQWMGFGHIEVGTVTPKAQKGNPHPRLFRLPQDEALINRMGFNNDGVGALVRRLEHLEERDFVLGGNIGKNKDTPNEEAVNDYLINFTQLHHLVDYFVVNISSPNTPGLRELQEKEPLRKLLSELQSANHGFLQHKPILLKIAPDLNDHQLADISEIINETGLNGIIATNTTIDRSGLKTDSAVLQEIGAGGLSGAPLRMESLQILKKTRSFLGADKVIIGVGGIMSAEDAAEKINGGADLVQVYTGFIYRGPGFVSQINKQLSQMGS
jgi:dihydroorotate dehydrogenase